MGQELPGETLAKVTDAVTRIWAKRHGHGPASGKSYAFDNFVVTVLHGGCTPQERTLLDGGHTSLVRQVRAVFEEELWEEYRRAMRELTGRELTDYQSQLLVRAGITIEFFVLAEST